MQALTLEEWGRKEEWNEFVKSSQQGSLFCRIEMLEALEKPFQLFAVRNGETIVAGFPLVFEKEERTPILQPHYFTLYQGLLFSSEVSQLPHHSRVAREMQIVEKILQTLSGDFKRISFSLHYRFEDLRPFQWFHYDTPEQGQFQIRLRYTGLLDLSAHKDFKSYFSSLRQSRYGDYNKAEKNNLTIESGDAKDIEEVHRLYQQTFSRQGLVEKEEHLQLLQRMTKIALNKGFGRLLFCRTPDGKRISSSFFLQDQTQAYYLFGGTDPEYRQTGSDTYVVLESIRKAMDEGVRHVDTLGINSPGRGAFKISLNAKPHPYFDVVWNR